MVKEEQLHQINDDNPIHTLTGDELLSRDTDFIVMIKAFEESFSQTVYSVSSYKAHEIKWSEKFVYIMNPGKVRINIDLGRLDETEKAEMNEY